MRTTAGRDLALGQFHNLYIGLVSAITNWRAGTVTELSYSGYARAQAALDAAENTTPTGGRQRKNSATVTLGSGNASGSTATAIGFGAWSAVSGGTLYHLALFDTDPPVLGTVSSASPGVITAPAHGLSVDQRVFVLAAPGASLPTGISEDTAYYVGTVPDANSFTLSTTPANANPVNTSSVGAGLFCPYTPVDIVANATPTFAAGALKFQE